MLKDADIYRCDQIVLYCPNIAEMHEFKADVIFILIYDFMVNVITM